MTPARVFMRRFWRDRRGNTAAEFALILPAFMFLTLGGINLSILVYATSSLNRVVQSAARYASIQTNSTGSSPSSATITAWARTAYVGPSINPQFTYSATGCGNTVTATATYNLFAGVIDKTIPLSATACFP